MRQAGAPGCGIPDDPASDAGPSGIRASPKEFYSQRPRFGFWLATLRRGFSSEPTRKNQNENWRSPHTTASVSYPKCTETMWADGAARGGAGAAPDCTMGQRVGAIMRPTD